MSGLEGRVTVVPRGFNFTCLHRLEGGLVFGGCTRDTSGFTLAEMVGRGQHGMDQFIA